MSVYRARSNGIITKFSKHRNIDRRLDGSFLALFLDTGANSSTELSIQSSTPNTIGSFSLRESDLRREYRVSKT